MQIKTSFLKQNRKKFDRSPVTLWQNNLKMDAEEVGVTM
jgi:hypothetical protein